MRFSAWALEHRRRVSVGEVPWSLLADVVIVGAVSAIDRSIPRAALIFTFAAAAATLLARQLACGRQSRPRLFGVASCLASAWVYVVPQAAARPSCLAEASVLVTLELLLASLEGHRSRSSASAPFIPLVGAVTSVVVIVFVASGKLRIFLAMAAPPAFLLQTLFGEFAAVGDSSHRETLRLREALAAEELATIARARDLLAAFLEGSLDSAHGLATMALAAYDHARRLTGAVSVDAARAYVATIDGIRTSIDRLRREIADKWAHVGKPESPPAPHTGRFLTWGQNWLTVLRDTSPGPLIDAGHMILGFSLVIALGAWIPHTSDAIALRPWRSFALLLASQSVIVFSLFRIKRGKDSYVEIAAAFIGLSLMEAQCAMFVVDSSVFGAYVYGSFLPIVVGWSLVEARVSFAQPYPLLGPVSVVACVAPLAPTRTHLLILVVSVAFAIVVGMVLSPIFRRQDEERMQQAELRAELMRRAESAPIRELSELANLTRVLAGRAHDVSGPLLGASLSASALEQELAAATPRAEYLKRIAVRGARHCKAMLQIIEDARATLERGPDTTRRSVELKTALLEVVQDARDIRSDVVFDVDGAEVVVPFVGGGRDLARALRNVVLNAAKWAKSEIRVRIERHPVRVVVEDDGPGFEGPWTPTVVPPLSLSATGGLGLHVTMQLLKGTGGRVEVDVSEQLGGARVTLFFEAEPREPSSSPVERAPRQPWVVRAR